MAAKMTAEGKMDKRTKEYKILKERLAKARKAQAGAKRHQSTLMRTKSGKVDKRTKEGKAMCAHGKSPQGEKFIV